MIEAPITKGLHSHYCNLCESDWDHRDQCQEGPVAGCPWCFPVEGAAPVPGARSGPHFHFCSECEQNWLHKVPCSAPLRAALAECSGCRDRAAGYSPREYPVLPIETYRWETGGAVRRFARKAVVPASIAAGIIIGIPASSPLWSRPALRIQVLKPPGTAPNARSERLPQDAPSIVADTRLQRDGERRVVQNAPEQDPTRSAPPGESSVAPTPPALGVTTRKAGGEIVAEAAPRAPEATPIVGSVPGALPHGGAALDPTRQGPHRFARTSPPPNDLPAWTAESPRWDRSAISALMHAVVEVRPSQRRALEPRPSQGFIIDELGHILTSAQRLGEATSLEVTLSDGRTIMATVVVRDRLNDIAVLRLARRGLPAIPLGDSGALSVGERVLAISNGIGSDRTPAAATVLATGAATGGHLAVDLSPRPDGVGGPLLNHFGEAVGILTDGTPSTGAPRKLTFAVPVDRVKSLLRNVRSRPMTELMSVPEGR